MNMADFEVDKGKCIGCGKCVKVCPKGAVRVLGKAHENSLLPEEEKERGHIAELR